MSRIIPEDQQELAAKYFTTENLGWPVALRLQDVETNFGVADIAHYADGVPIDDELKHWRAESKKPGYHANDWIDNIYPALTA